MSEGPEDVPPRLQDDALPPPAGSPESEVPGGEALAGGPERGGRAARSPRLRTPRHHLLVRPGAKTRRRAITLAGVMLLVASVLGFATAAGILSQASANRPPPLPGDPVEVHGTVTDLNNTRLTGATVRLMDDSKQAVTNAEGSYYLGTLAPGTYTLEASHPGHMSVRKTVEVSPAIPKVVDFALPPGSGVVDVNPEPVPTYNDPTLAAYALGIAVLLCSSLAALGAWSAVTHRHYLLAVGGAAAGALTIGAFFLGSALAIVALAILGSLKHGFVEARDHRIPWEEKSPANRRSRMRAR